MVVTKALRWFCQVCDGRGLPMMRGLYALGLAAMLVGCANEAEQRGQAAANDDARCQSYGVSPGSPGYVQCRMNMDNLRAQNEQQNKAIIAQCVMTNCLGP